MLTSEGNVLTTRRKKETFWGLFFPMGVEKKNEKKEKNTKLFSNQFFFFFTDSKCSDFAFHVCSSRTLLYVARFSAFLRPTVQISV